ncbi:MAG: DUF3794 domain-containing protein [Clostridia bacterium]|nr:DUF3794 domain-containing protein [Clostridia bacterium]
MAVYWPYSHPGIPKIQEKQQKILSYPNIYALSKDNQEEIDINIDQRPKLEMEKSGDQVIIRPIKFASGCRNLPINPDIIKEKVVTIIPVILSRFAAQISRTFFINLPEIVLKILKIDNKVMIKKCVLLQNTKTLFIKGVIRKSIIYTTARTFDYKSLPQNLRHCTVNIPFACFTSVKFNGNKPLPLLSSWTRNYSYHNGTDIANVNENNDRPFFPEFCPLSGGSYHYFNQRPYCELEYSKIVENNQIIRRAWANSFPYTCIEEKTVLLLTFLLLQNQPVLIPAPPKKNKKC